MKTTTFLSQRRAKRQQGLSLIFALITLVALMLGALALVRNTDTGTLLLGNLGFKQEATQTADQAAREAIDWLQTNKNSLGSDRPADGYYASTKEFASDGITAAGVLDITGNQYPSNPARQLIGWGDDGCASYGSDSYAACIKATPPKTINAVNEASYIIFRMCNKEGDATPSDSTVVCAKPMSGTGGTSSVRGALGYGHGRINSTSQMFFRVLVRIKGQRDTYSYTETIVHF